MAIIDKLNGGFIIKPNKKYSINRNLIISRVDGGRLDLKTTKGTVTIHLYGKEYTVKKQWLYWIAHYDVDLPEHLQDRLMDIDFTPIKFLPTKSKTLVTMYFKKPIYFDEGYRLVPNNTELAVDKYGNIVNIKTKIHYDVVTNRYLYIGAYNHSNHNRSQLAIHRAVALAWISNDDYYERFTVNHIDGNKLNNYAGNLEWVTTQENTNHAKKEGLRKDNLPCKIRNYYTGNIREFLSITDACKYMGITPRSSKELLLKRKEHLFKGTYEFKLLDDDNPWFYEDGKLAEDSKGYFKFIVTYATGDTREYYNKNTLAVKHNLPYSISTISTFNKEKIINMIKDKWGDKIINIVIIPLRSVDIKQEALEISTGKVYVADNSSKLSKMINVDRRQISKRIKLNQPNHVTNGYLIRKQSSKPWPLPEQYIYPKKVVKLINNDTGKAMVFKSMRACSRYLGVNLSVVQKRVKNKTPYLNYTIEEVFI